MALKPGQFTLRRLLVAVTGTCLVFSAFTFPHHPVPIAMVCAGTYLLVVYAAYRKNLPLALLAICFVIWFLSMAYQVAFVLPPEKLPPKRPSPSPASTTHASAASMASAWVGDSDGACSD
jgi:hypothetical protein